MANQQSQRPSSKPEIVTVPLFESGHEGMGNADYVGGFRYNRIHGSVDARWPGQIRRGLLILAETDMDTATLRTDRVPVFAVEWASGGNPLVYFLVHRRIYALQYGAVTEVGTNSLGTQSATAGMFDDDGSGVPYLYAGFGGISTSNSIVRMNQAQSVASAGAAGALVADLLMSLNGRAYRTITPTGGGANCQVSTCPYGSDRFTAANWSAGQTVGLAGTNITALASVRQAPVAIKPEGIFAYSESLDRWINYTPSWRGFVHPDNGKGAFSLGDLLIVPMGDGGAVTFDGYAVNPFDPVSLDSNPNLHTTRSSFQAMGAMRHWIVGVSPPASKLIEAGSGGATSASVLRAWTEISSAFTDYSSELRDVNPTTKATFSIGGTTDYLWLGWTMPFAAFRLTLGTVNAVARTMTVYVGDSDGNYQHVTARDFTSVETVTLAQDGSVVMTEDPVAVEDWAPTTVNGVSAYWVRIQFSGALTANVEVTGAQIQPWYPSVDDVQLPLDGLDRSGCLPHVLFGRLSEGRPVWHDLFSLTSPDEIGVVLYCNAGGANVNNVRSLILFGRYYVWRVYVFPDDRPGTAAAPYLHGYNFYEAPSIIPVPGKVCRLKEVRVNGYGFDSDFPGRFYHTWDWGKSWNRLGPTVMRAPAAFKVKSGQRGHRFRWGWGWGGGHLTAVHAPTQPVVTSIEADFEVLPDPLDSVQERPLQLTANLPVEPRF